MEGRLGPVLSVPGQTPEASKALGSRGYTVSSKWPHRAKGNARHYPLTQSLGEESISFPLASGSSSHDHSGQDLVLRQWRGTRTWGSPKAQRHGWGEGTAAGLQGAGPVTMTL